MLERIAWGLLALLHAVPAVGLFRPSLLTRLYGVARRDPTFLLLHHRAALFGIIVLVCVWAATQGDVRRLATVAVGLSVISFLLLYRAAGAPPALRGIAIADLMALPIVGYVGWQAFVR